MLTSQEPGERRSSDTGPGSSFGIPLREPTSGRGVTARRWYLLRCVGDVPTPVGLEQGDRRVA
jgi:hypothetical protein